MEHTVGRPVVVGIGARDGLDAALDAAAAEAERRGCGIRLVHVIPPLDVLLPASTEQLTLADSTLRQAGQSRLYRAEERLHGRLQQAVPVETELAQGAVVPCLVGLSGDASLVVVQRGPRLRHRVVTLVHLAGVAARASCPVLCVPPGWRRDTWEARPVCVGVEADPAPAVVQTALELAAGTTGRLRLVCAPGHVTFTGHEGESWAAYVDEVVRSAVADVLEEWPEVDVEVVASRGRPVDALLAESRECSVLVLGRHHHLLPRGSHLGPVVGTMLREADCPVLVVDPGRNVPPGHDPRPCPDDRAGATLETGRREDES